MKNQATDLSYVTRNRHTAGVSNVDNLVWVNRIRKVLEMFKPCLTNKEASTVLCSVIKHAGSGWSTKEV